MFEDRLTRRGAGGTLHSHQEEIMAQVKDPVCGMMIEPSDAVGSSQYEGKTYYFCSEDCKVEFDANPEDYAENGGGQPSDRHH